MKNEQQRRAALVYHAKPSPGKTKVVPTKNYNTQRDLALAYSPGVAIPCLEIDKKTSDVYKYTNKGNLVAVISNGTAVLGLGDIGPNASKPVMEGKALLFKIFAGIDVFEIEPPESSNPLLRNKKVLLSPHAATFTKECLENMSLETAQNLIDFFENKIEKNKNLILL